VAEFSIIIPAAGLGTRLGLDQPKATVRLLNQTIIERQLDLLQSRFPSAPILVVGGYKADYLRNILPRSIQFIQNESYHQNNVAFSIHLAIKRMETEEALVVYGDLVFDDDFVWNICIEQSSVLVGSAVNRRYEVGVNVVDGKAVHFSHGTKPKWCHVAYFAENEANLFSEFAAKRPRLFGFEIMNFILDVGGSFKVNEAEGLVEVDEPDDVRRAKRLLTSTS
jgi:choline kinase